MARAVHQVLGTFADRDAVGCHALALREALRSRGVDSEIYADEITEGARGLALPIEALARLPRDPESVLVYQAAGFAPAADTAARRNETFVVNYHNVTPSGFFTPWEPTVAPTLDAARLQLGRLAPQTVLAIADSRFNRHDLLDMGYHRVEVVPVLIDTQRLTTIGRSLWPERPGTRWLFVGRIAPNKAQHEVIKSFAVYRQLDDPDAVLALPGRSSSHRYRAALDAFIAALDLDSAVLRPGSLPDAELGALYRDADVFVCLSHHEGFCNTVIEAMAFGVPVVSGSEAALPETIGPAGLLLDRASPALVAAAVRRVVTDSQVRHSLVEAGLVRHSLFALASAADRICDLVLQLEPA
jgi:L-malate glycosyltransferase